MNGSMFRPYPCLHHWIRVSTFLSNCIQQKGIPILLYGTTREAGGHQVPKSNWPTHLADDYMPSRPCSSGCEIGST